MLDAFLAQFYDDKPAPAWCFSRRLSKVPTSCSRLSHCRAGRKVEISVPHRGEKRDLVDHALTNAREALGRRLAETLLAARSSSRASPRPLGSRRRRSRIEVYDNSHIMGTNAVGGMIVAGPEGFCKNSYRKFNIRSEDLSPGDDYGMMREVLKRRFSRLLKESPRELVDAESSARLTRRRRPGRISC